MINVFVPGVPREKGNLIANRFGVGIHDVGGKQLRDWMRTVGDYVAVGIRRRGHGVQFPLFDNPDTAVYLGMAFFLPRPKTVTRRFPTRKHDRDKLERAVHDALTGILYVDDGQACDGPIRKFYAMGEQSPGVHLVIARAELPESMTLL